jgi:WD40 repeat protein
MATSDATGNHGAIAPPSSHGESAIVRQMAELADSMPLDESQSPSAIRDIVECLQLFSQSSQWTSGSTGVNACESTASELAAEPLESVEAAFTSSRFEIRRMLGHGGFGVVLLAFDKRLGREVALKVPRPEILALSSIRERFLREAQAAAALDHPNIVPVYDTGELGPIWFITSRYIDGPTLAEWIHRQGATISSQRAAKLVALLAEAVQHAHSRGVLHCDLKPANVLLEPVDTQPDGQFPFVPRLSDFGLARYVDECDPSSGGNSLVGTPRYMAPEQAACRHKDVGIQTDVYGLGAILFELMIGKPPFVGRDDGETLRQIIAAPVPVTALRQFRIARDLQAICLKCLEKEPSNRYENAAALATDLRRFLSAEPVTARPAGLTERFALWCKRRPLQAALCAVLCVVSFAGVAGISWQWNRAEYNLAATRSLLYAANIQLADVAWGQRNIRAVNALLEPFDVGLNSDQDMRGWEWYYFHRLCHQDLATLHIGQSIDCMVVCPIAQTAFVGTAKGKVASIDMRSRKINWTIDAFDQKVIAVGATPDGQRLAAIDRTGHLKIWKVDSRPELTNQNTLNHGEIMAAAFDADVNRLAMGDGDFQIHVIRLDPLQPINTCAGHTATVKSVFFARNEAELLSSSEDGSVRLWSMGSGKQKFMALHPNGQWILHAALSHDGHWIAAGSQDGNLLAWEVGSQEPAFVQQGHSDGISSVSFSPQDDRLITTSTDRSLRLWSFPNFQLLKAFWGHENAPSAASAISDQQLISIGRDGTLKFWDTKQDSLENPPSFHTHVGSVAFGSDGRTLAMRLQDGTVVVNDWPQMREAYRFAGPPGLDALAYNSERRLCAVSRGDGAVEVWQGQNRVHVLQRPSPVMPGTTPTLPGKNRDRVLPPHLLRILCLSFSHDARWLAVGSRDGGIFLWDPSSGVLKHRILGHERGVCCVAFHPSEPWLVALTNDEVRVIDAETGETRRTLGVHNGRVYSAAFDPAGTLLAVGDRTGDIIILDTRSFTPRATLSGHTDRVFGCRFAPSGQRVVSCGRDGTIRWWDVAGKRELCVLRGDWGSLESLDLSPDGWSLLSVSESNDLRIWKPHRKIAPAFALPE